MKTFMFESSSSREEILGGEHFYFGVSGKSSWDRCLFIGERRTKGEEYIRSQDPGNKSEMRLLAQEVFMLTIEVTFEPTRDRNADSKAAFPLLSNICIVILLGFEIKIRFEISQTMKTSQLYLSCLFLTLISKSAS